MEPATLLIAMFAIADIPEEECILTEQTEIAILAILKFHRVKVAITRHTTLKTAILWLEKAEVGIDF
jgi:hypothetical protein